VWKMVPCCLLWCLWRERNDRQFKDKESIKSLTLSMYAWVVGFISLEHTFSLKVPFVEE